MLRASVKRSRSTWVADEDDPGVRHDRGRTHSRPPLPCDQLANEEQGMPPSARPTLRVSIGSARNHRGKIPLSTATRMRDSVRGRGRARAGNCRPRLDGRSTHLLFGELGRMRALSHVFHDRRSLGSRVVASVVQTTAALRISPPPRRSRRTLLDIRRGRRRRLDVVDKPPGRPGSRARSSGCTLGRGATDWVGCDHLKPSSSGTSHRTVLPKSSSTAPSTSP